MDREWLARRTEAEAWVYANADHLTGTTRERWPATDADQAEEQALAAGKHYLLVAVLPS